MCLLHWQLLLTQFAPHDNIQGHPTAMLSSTKLLMTTWGLSNQETFRQLGVRRCLIQDGGEDRRFTEVLSQHAQKHCWQLSSQPSPAQQQSLVVQSTGEQARSRQNGQCQQAKRVMLDRSTIASNRLAAAKPIKKKAVFCLDNISSTYSADNVWAYVTSLLTDVVSCFQVQPRHLRYGANYDRRAFQLCIFDTDRTRLLDVSKWPDSVIISEWYHKPATNVRQQQSQQHRNVSAAGNTVSAGDAVVSTASAASIVPTTVSAPLNQSG